MRTTVTLALSFLALSATAQTLFTEDFETTPAYTLNTGDANSAVSANNRWAVNAVYAGGSAESTCILPVTFEVPATAGQPAGSLLRSPSYWTSESPSAAARAFRSAKMARRLPISVGVIPSRRN